MATTTKLAARSAICDGTTSQFIRGDGSIGDIDTGMILTVPTVDGTANGVKINDFNSGFSSTAIGNLLYLDSSATWQLCDKDTEVSCAGMLGIALEAKSSGSPVNVAFPGTIVYATGFPTLTIGGLCYIGDSGAITQTQPSGGAFIRVIGWAVHADKIYFNPSADYFQS